VVTGIGFLGGGAILSGSRHVRGLTTAASIWTTAGIGLLVGIQRYTLAAGATLLAFIVLRYFTKFEAEITETKNEDAA
jgi:putative Mg2+ transporter-C (MgtC) family protein